MFSLESSVLNSFAYNADNRRLAIMFKGGELYEYYDVPPEVIGEFLSHTSFGQFFNERVRNRFAFAKVDSINLA